MTSPSDPTPTSDPGKAPRQPAAPGAQPQAPAQPRMSVVVVEDAAALAEYVPAWQALADEAIEPNVFHEPWVLLPAIRLFGARQALRFVLVFTADRQRPPGAPLLCGFFPLRRHRYHWLPVSLHSLWAHEYSYLSTPLLRAGYARECLAAFSDWLDSDPRGCPLMELTSVTGEGEFHHLLVDHLRERERLTYVTRTHTRAFFRPRADADAYLRAALSSDQRRNLKRKERRLSEAGRLAYEELGPGGDVEGWAQAFLSLEASGWKGRAKTALACSEAGREYFLTLMKEGALRGRLLMHALLLDGRPIALRCNFTAREGSFFFKPAFDEAYARFSPGLLLEVETIRRLHTKPEIRWMDSCTSPDNQMMNNIWVDRRVIQTTLVATRTTLGGGVISLIPLVRWLKAHLHFRGR